MLLNVAHWRFGETRTVMTTNYVEHVVLVKGKKEGPSERGGSVIISIHPYSIHIMVAKHCNLTAGNTEPRRKR